MGSPKPDDDLSRDLAADMAACARRPLGEKLRARADLAQAALEQAEADPSLAADVPRRRIKALATKAAADQHDRETAEAGEHADALIAIKIKTADIALAKTDTTPQERRQWLQIKTICVAGLSRIADPRERLRKTQAAQTIYFRVVLPYIETRSDRTAPLDLDPPAIPRALLRATEPKSHTPRACSPTRGPPTRGEPSEDPDDAGVRPIALPPVDALAARSALGAGLVAALDRRQLLHRARAHPTLARRLRAWRRPGVRAPFSAVDRLLLEAVGLHAEDIGPDEGVWLREGPRSRPKTVAECGRLARQRSGDRDLLGMAA